MSYNIFDCHYLKVELASGVRCSQSFFNINTNITYFRIFSMKSTLKSISFSVKLENIFSINHYISSIFQTKICESGTIVSR